MVRWLIFAFSALVSTAVVAGDTSVDARQPIAFPPGIQNVLALPEDQIDTGVAALTFAKEIYPEIDIATYSTRIDVLARQAKQTVDHSLTVT